MATPRTGRPLVVTSDPQVLDDVLRLAAFAGVEVQVAADARAARPFWGSAACVLVGADAVAGCVSPGSSGCRRPDVVVLATAASPELWQQALGVGAAAVLVLPAEEEELLHLLSSAGEPPGPPGVVVAVIGGCGGAGATTLAAGLAVAAVRRGSSALLVDGDPLGGGIDLALGGAPTGGLRWPDLATARGWLPAGALLGALPRAADVPVLAWDRGAVLDGPPGRAAPADVLPGRAAPADLPPAAMDAVLAAGRRAGCFVVVDVPRAEDDTSRGALAAADAVLLVVPAELRAVVAASSLVGRLGLRAGAVHLVVRDPRTTGLSGARVAAALGVPLRACVRTERGLAGRVERRPHGRRRGSPLTALCTRLVEELLVELVGADRRADE